MISILVTVGALVAAAGAVPYILAVMRGTARPKLVSWIVWDILAGVMMVSALAEGAIASAVMTAVTVIACTTVVLLGWRHRSGRISKLDMVCLVGALIGIASLAVFKNPLAALGVSITVDIIAFIPTLVHIWHSPYEESLACFALSAVGGLFAMTAVLLGTVSLAALLYPVYSVLFNGAASLLIVSGRSKSLLGHPQYEDA